MHPNLKIQLAVTIIPDQCMELVTAADLERWPNLVLHLLPRDMVHIGSLGCVARKLRQEALLIAA